MALFSKIVAFSFFLLSSLVAGDIYLQNPAGSNNRLRDTNEQNNRQRDNANRLFDSENNDRGGYEAPTWNSGRLYFYEQSVLTIEWTAQHSCANPNNDCQFILQYMCDNAGLVRDGSNAFIQSATGRIPINPDRCMNQDCDSDYRYGRHEPLSYYLLCDRTIQNHGLYHADRNTITQTNGNDDDDSESTNVEYRARFKGSAARTRQNNNGNRHGYECPEERDYYPYWRPSPWRDIAILTSRPERCAAYRDESQNVQAKMQCIYPNGLVQGSAQEILRRHGYSWIPINEKDCLWAGACNALSWMTSLQGINDFSGNGGLQNSLNNAACRSQPGVWTAVAGWGIPKPDCIDMRDWTRDNSLGNTIGGEPYQYNWTIPSDYSESCVLRIRYNITSGDYNFNLNAAPSTTLFGAGGDNFGFASITSVQGGQLNAAYDASTRNANGGNRPTKLPIWRAFGLNISDIIDPASNEAIAGGNTAPKYTRGYVAENNPHVDIFGPLLMNAAGSPINTPGTLTQNNANNDNGDVYVTAWVALRLAHDLSQFSRTFEDRSHMFAIRQRPPALRAYKIHNVNVRGKRGNIVQSFPSVEHDFIPNRLVVNNGELIHFQWMLSDYNNQNNAGQGRAGTSRSNVIVLRSPAYVENGLNLNSATKITVGHLGANYPGRIDGKSPFVNNQPNLDLRPTVQYTPFLGFGFIDLNSLAYTGMNYSYFDLGPRQVLRAGIYNYMSSRNNNFSNRDQKGTIIVLPVNTPVEPLVWGMGSSTNAQINTGASDSSTWTAGAYIDYAPQLWANPGTAIVQQEIWLQAFDNSGYDTPWIQVNPPMIQVTEAAFNLLEPGQAPLWLKIPHSFKPLHDAIVWYKMNATTQALMQIDSEDDGYTTSIPLGGSSMNQGGYYAVQMRVNQAYIAAIVIGSVLLVAVVSYLYWKVRIQPSGGFQSWLRERKRLLNGSTAQSDSIALTASNAA